MQSRSQPNQQLTRRMERLGNRAEHREKMGAQDRRSETRMVSRMDDARSVQRGAPLGAEVADSKRVRRSRKFSSQVRPTGANQRTALPLPSASLPRLTTQ